MHGQRVGDGVSVTLRFKDAIGAAVIDTCNSMRIEHMFAIDDGPVSHDVTHLERGGILNSGIDDQVAGLQSGIHGVRLNGEGTDTQNAGHTAAGRGNEGNIGANSRQNDRNDKDHVDYDIQNLFDIVFFRAILLGRFRFRNACFGGKFFLHMIYLLKINLHI